MKKRGMEEEGEVKGKVKRKKSGKGRGRGRGNTDRQDDCRKVVARGLVSNSTVMTLHDTL